MTQDEEVKGGGSNIDDVYDTITMAYDDLGRADAIKTLKKSDNSVANGVKFEYTKLWQITKVWEDVDGDTFSGGTPKVQYVYQDKKVADGNWRRLWNMTYPDGEKFIYRYDGSGTPNNKISRLEKIREDLGASFETAVIYDYIGLSMMADVDLAVPDVQLDFQAQHNGTRTEGEYAGYDRFGRVIKQHWVDGGFTTHATDNTVRKKEGTRLVRRGGHPVRGAI